MKRYDLLMIALFCLLPSCTPKENKPTADAVIASADSLVVKEAQEEPRITEIRAQDISLDTALTYHLYTLEKTYPYKDTVRQFQFEQFKAFIAQIENIQRDGPQPWAVLQNRKNVNGQAPLAHRWSRNEYDNVADSLGVERFQGIPLHHPADSAKPVRYGRDGELVRLVQGNDSSEFYTAETIYVPGSFIIPRKYVKTLDTISIEKIVFVDRENQNTAAVEKVGDRWLIRSMNPATTGLHRPPYGHDTPLGIFVVQEKKDKMYYLRDGTSQIAGYAPWASRFTNGGYIHGVPTNNPNGSIIEYSRTLGTIPRSHMCVRNASSHAKFVYDWVNVGDALVIVIE